jgi:hypothetical protein
MVSQLSEDMQNDPEQDAPDEHKIEVLLSGFKPQPSPRFFTLISSAPWLNEDLSLAPHKNMKWRLKHKYAWGFTALLLLLGILGFAFFPSVRVTASQIMHYFLPAASDQLDVQVTLSNPNDLLDFSNPANFPLTISAVQQRAGFVIKQIPYSLTAPHFIGARYDLNYNAVTILYTADDYALLLTQRPLGNSQDVFSVGANAKVDFVTIGDVQGEFVMGGWNAVSIQPGPSTTTTPTSVQIEAVWDASLPQSTLRWQEPGFAYELRCSGVNRASQSQLLTWANELK